ncbi:transposase [Neobacillus sp. PS3-40]|uniref:transposase n=1 Tax=Neobacillus sp. PS3-40 TaxID=3070679 RepID=UPI0027E0CDA2|nr:transposase [Neobacillus sp. PS3-40]WML43460.1 transposase [Neobacillus sp. PS3-40]
MSSPTYVLTLPLKVETWQEHILEKRLNIGRTIYNECLGEALRRYKYMIRNPRYWEAVRMTKGNERNQLLNHYKKQYGVRKFDLNRYVQGMGRTFKKNIGSQMAQNIAERAFQAVEKVMYGNGKKVRFCSVGQFFSLEEKTNKTGFRYFPKNKRMEWLGLIMPVILKNHDEYAHIALQDKIKYCRLVKKVIRGKNRYFVQFALEGFPPKKRNQNYSKDEFARVGLDIGTSTLAIASENEVKLYELAEGLSVDESQKRILQRKLDCRRRANNPNKYNADGTINKSNREKWIQSENYKKTRQEVAEMSRKMADKRKQSHNQLANHILTLGLDVRVETMNFKGFQAKAKKTKISEKTGRYKRKKRFGKSLANRAPSMLLTIIDNKLKYFGLELKRIDTAKVKASQFEHFTQTCVKKKLSKRWNHFEQGDVQRDLYSAFLIMNTKDNLREVDVGRANETWNNFFRKHEQEIERMKHLNKKQLSSIGL